MFFQQNRPRAKAILRIQAEKSNTPPEGSIMDKIVRDSITPQVPGFYRIPQICQEYSGAREYWLNLSSDSTTMQALWFYFSY